MSQTVATQADRPVGFERHEIDEQLNRILGSVIFRTSPVLQSLLRFIVAKAQDRREDWLTEQFIAKEVFSRDSDFDCSVDTVVRTHAYRLRQKLKEYYAGTGSDDTILIEIPKGHYRVRFSRREEKPHLPAAVNRPEPVPIPAAKTTTFSTRALVGFAFVSLFSLLAGVLVGRGMRPGGLAFAAEDPPPPQLQVDRFWNQFLGADRSPIIAYSNDLYLTTQSGNLLMFSGPTADRGTVASREVARLGVPGFDLFRAAGPFYFEDDKTDVGEVESASVLTAQLVRMGLRPTLKRGRVITMYDLESHNVIFLGSPFANKILTQVEGNSNFVFRDGPGAPSVWAGVIHNLHPLPGESQLYSLEREANSQALKTDYGVIASLPGVSPARKILVLGGLTTSGTQAAAQFVTSTDGIAAMLSRLNQKRKTRTEQWPSHFEYLLRVRLDRGLDVIRAECSASRSYGDPAEQ